MYIPRDVKSSRETCRLSVESCFDMPKSYSATGHRKLLYSKF